MLHGDSGRVILRAQSLKKGLGMIFGFKLTAFWGKTAMGKREHLGMR